MRGPAGEPIETERLSIMPMPQAAAAALPGDRSAAAVSIGAALDDEWPMPDVVDIFPTQAAAANEQLPYGVWLILERATTSVVGDVGFMGPPTATGEVEIGYSVIPSRRRRGYATEAVGALVAWAFAQPGIDAVLATTDRDNAISQRVLQHAGFTDVDGTGEQVHWRLQRPEAG